MAPVRKVAEAAGFDVRWDRTLGAVISKGGETVLSVRPDAVTIQTSVCPECGRSYVSGGETNTMIRYSNESNPYQKELKKTDAVKLRGANVDLVA